MCGKIVVLFRAIGGTHGSIYILSGGLHRLLSPLPLENDIESPRKMTARFVLMSKEAARVSPKMSACRRTNHRRYVPLVQGKAMTSF